MKNITDNHFLALQNFTRLFTVVSSTASLFFVSLILNNLFSKPIQVDSLLSKGIFTIVGILILFADINVIVTSLHGMRNESKVNPNSFLYNALIQIIVLILIVISNVDWTLILKQPVDSNLIMLNTHFISQIMMYLVIAVIIAGFSSIVSSILKNYMINHPQIIKKNINVNNNLGNDERKAPRKK